VGRGGDGKFCRSAFNAGVKEKNTKTNKITIAKNQNLATQNFLF
jgi:hypothetical protein